MPGMAVEAAVGTTCDALRALLAARAPGASLTADLSDRPDWGKLAGEWLWARTLDITIEAADGSSASGELDWPDVCDDTTGSDGAGSHRGFYVGGPLDVGTGMRLTPGWHAFQGAGGQVRLVVSPDLGPDLALDGGDVPRAIASAAAAPDRFRYPDDDAVAIAAALDGFVTRPRRLARSELREVGPADIVAELVFATALARVGRTAESTRSKLTAAEVLCAELEAASVIACRWLRSGGAGSGALVGRSTQPMTLARLEASQRVSFIGFRGLWSKLRGRADLRDLDPSWRGTLCPVQTPESTDVGLVRYRAVGDGPVREHADEALVAEWGDLSASAALIPYVNHDEPARASIGSKNLKQALPVAGAEPPLVATGWEGPVAETAGVARASAPGVVESVGPDAVVVRGVTGRKQVTPYGVRDPGSSGPVGTWTVTVAVGDRVRRGTLLAHAPDVVLVDGEPVLALGVNALVALTPYRGMTYEDAIVVSESLAARLETRRTLLVTERLRPGDAFMAVADLLPGIGGDVDAGDTLYRVVPQKGEPVTVRAPEAGRVLGVGPDPTRGIGWARLEVVRPLAVGDKLSNRHQGKGCVSLVLPDDEMPRLPDGRPVDAVLNPLGVLRRLNIGQLWEMHAGLPSYLSGGDPVIAGRVVASPEEVARACAEVGLPRGRAVLSNPDGTRLGGEAGVVVGPQYLMRLNHLPDDKLSVRGSDLTTSARNGQPSRTTRFRGGVKIGAAQRFGEMEIWALRAAGADEVLADALLERAARPDTDRGVRPSLAAVDAHLRAAGLALVDSASGAPVTAVDALEVRSVDCVTLDGAMPALPDWERADRWRPAPADLMDLVQRESRQPDEDPLYSKASFGPGSGGPRGAWYAIPLPAPVPHPWRRPSWPALPDLTQVVVLPPAYRFAGADPLDRRYRMLITVVRRLAAQERLEPRDLALLRRRVWSILGSPRVADTDSILGRLTGKQGLLRRSLLGQSVIRSARGVLVPDLTLAPDEVGLPQAVVEALGVEPDGTFGDVVILNRQPSLHPYNLVALRGRPREGAAVRVHPMLLGQISGDFDGDTVAVHRPIRASARANAWRTLSLSENLRSSAAGAPLAKSDLDIALGWTLMRRTEPGRQELVATAGGDAGGDLVDEALRHAESPTDAVRRVDRLERAGFGAATGWSIGALDLLFDGRDGVLAEAIEAGAAGKPSGQAQLLERRGQVPGADPAVPVADVDGCFLTGLSNDDWFATAPGSLAGLAEKKLMSPHAGALTKLMVDIADEVVCQPGACGTSDELRSPLTCSSAGGPCQACYGADPATGLPPEPGRAVGVLAALLIGERSTQLSMKVFHGGSGKAGELSKGVNDLRALMGRGSTVIEPGGEPETLGDYLSRCDLSGPGQVRDALRPVADRTVQLLGDKVDQVHVEVLLRCLVDAFGSSEPGALADAAARRGRTPLDRATSRGNISTLVAQAALGERAGGTGPTARTRLLTGGML